jgi:hypothetical protein
LPRVMTQTDRLDCRKPTALPPLKVVYQAGQCKTPGPHLLHFRCISAARRNVEISVGMLLAEHGLVLEACRRVTHQRAQGMHHW